MATWGASPDRTDVVTMDGRTVRNILHTSVSGEGLRISLSNAFGSQPVTFDDVWVGTHASGAAVVERTNRQVKFSGSTSITVPPGADVLSDPLDGKVAAGQTLAVSVHAKGDPGTVTGHNVANQTSYLADGNHAADEAASSFIETTSRWYWVDALVVDQAQQVGTVVTFGDSITDGNGSTSGANRRWPDFLARRLQQEPAPRQFGVMNQGISANRVLTDGSGVNAQARFDRDVLSQPGVETVVLMEGINDIRWRHATSAEDLTSAYRQLIARAHARGICVVGGTLTPWAGGSLYSEDRNEVRKAVNEWIRGSGAFDAVVDFDKVTRDPANPDRFLPAYDSGDHLHPGDAGYEAMANAVDLADLRCDR
ncbi:MAG TPA: SGNH/GDSL hydrolase family protein [Actinomycetales bacterium]|nr:SGNH/GDSL hydrolase family protein [Actinomycetales bacterium]